MTTIRTMLQSRLLKVAVHHRLLITVLLLVASVGAVISVPLLTASAAPNANCQANYTVVWGDTLAKIGAKYGVSVQQIADANGIANPNLIYAGSTLCIPNTSSSDASSGSSQASSSSSGGGGYYPNYYPWGQCTWWAAQSRLDENLEGLGDAWLWASNAPGNGLSTGTTPAVGATVVFQPGVQGASSLGHVSHVVAVNGDGSFQVSEMNYYANGGGFGIVSYRTAWVGTGVSFIY